MPFEKINHQLFLALNAAAHPPSWIVLIARIMAEWIVYAAVLWMVIAWIRSTPKFRFVLLDGFLAAVTGLSINQIINALWYHPRPFEVPLGNQFLAHATNSSFPSDHAVFMFALALAFLSSMLTRSWGWLFMLLGLAVAWSRIYLGVHFPFDMIGAFGVATFSTIIVKLVSSLLRSNIYPMLLELYVEIISILRLPEGLFPRSK